MTLKCLPAKTRATLALLWFTAVADAVEPINFEVRNNADLVAICDTSTADPNYVAAIHFCHGVGVGFVRYAEALTENRDFRPLFCFPQKLTRNAAMKAYVAYSKAHLEYNRDLIGDVMTKFLIENYPCPTVDQPQTGPSMR